MLQATSPGSGVGPEELFEVWPVLVRVGWFAAGAVVSIIVGLYVLEPAVSRAVARRNPNNRTVQEAVSRYVQVLVVLVAIYVGAATAGYSRFVTGSALVVAAVTLAVGVAGQSTVASLVSGLVLVLDPEFNIGDFVEWGDRAGTIRSITLRVTRVQTTTGELVTIPNTVLTREAVTRPYGHGRYQVVERVPIDAENDVSTALDRLTAAATAVDGVLDAPDPCSYVDELGEDGVVLRTHFWVAEPDPRREAAVRSAFARAAKERLESAGISVGTSTEHVVRGRLEVDNVEDE